MTLGQRIQKIRKEKGFSQEDMAAALCVSRQAVSKWENDVSRPDTEYLLAIAALLEIELSCLVDEQVQQEAVVRDERKTVQFPWLKILLIILTIAAVVFFALWRIECHREQKLELLCQACASGCLDSLLAYAETGDESDYLSAAAEFRGFMQSYHLLTERQSSHANYTFLNEAYGYMLCGRDKIEGNLDLLTKAMGKLSRDIYDFEGHELMYNLYVALRHG